MCILLIFNYKERKDRGLPFRSPGPVLLSAVWERSAGSLADVEPFSLSCGALLSLLHFQAVSEPWPPGPCGRGPDLVEAEGGRGLATSLGWRPRMASLAWGLAFSPGSVTHTNIAGFDGEAAGG